MFSRELSAHGRAFVNYEALKHVLIRDMAVDGYPARLMFNPGRVRSVMADVSASTLAKRACFLCPDGLEEHQLTTNWQHYRIRVNPFPIFTPHFTVSFDEHVRQELAPHYADMLALAKEMPEYTIFYNGPMCGASAPDHMHFQAVPRHSMPAEDNWKQCYNRSSFCFKSASPISMKQQFDALCAKQNAYIVANPYKKDVPLTLQIDEWEPRMNVLSWFEPADETSTDNQAEGTYKTIIFFRSESRPECFFAEDEADRILISPGSVEMGGVGIVSSAESFEKLSPERLRSIIREVGCNYENDYYE